MSEAIYLVSTRWPGPDVPGHELADPECPEYPGLLDRPEVERFMQEQGYGVENPDELMFLVREEDPGSIPRGLPVLKLEV